MQITKKLEYAVLSMLYLAKEGKACDIAEISKEQGIPVSFLAKIMQDLSRAELVASKRGVNGGYTLVRPAENTNLLDVMFAVEGPVALSDCLKEAPDCSNFSVDSCLLRPVWGELQEVIQAKLESISLASIIEVAATATRAPLAAFKELPQRPVILCDFDGTISLQDVSDTIFTLWLGEDWAAIDKSYHEGKMSMVEAYEMCWPQVKATEAEIADFVDTIEIDPFFERFDAERQGANIPLYLVSDGFDYYIERIMGRYGLSHLDYYSNKLWFENDAICLHFGNQHKDCVDCANCKKRILDEKRAEANFIIYIGNGNSDRCAAEHADLVFAKDSLAKHCERKGVPYVAYRQFDEIIDYLKEMGVFSA